MTKKIFVGLLLSLLVISVSPAITSTTTSQAKSTTPVVAATMASQPIVVTTPTPKPARVKSHVSRSKVRATLKPSPTKVIATHAPAKVVRRVAIPVQRETKTPQVHVNSAPGGVAACIRKYESGNNYQAENPRSSASGAYQFLDSTWHAVTGLPGRAKDYSPAIQDAAFVKLWAGGKNANQWETAHLCGY